MKNKSILTIIFSSLGVYALRRIRSKAVTNNVERTIFGFLGRMLFRTVHVPAGKQLYEMGGHALGKCFRYKGTEVSYEDQTITHQYASSSIVRINKVPVFIKMSNSGPYWRTIWIPKWWFSKVEKELYDLSTPKMSTFPYPSVYEEERIRSPEDSIEFSFCSTISDGLDHIPIHSQTRAILDKHLADMRREWATKKNVKYARNLLLVGPKGSGKTHIAYAMAFELKSDVYKYPGTNSARLFSHFTKLLPYFSTLVADEIQEIPQFKKEELRIVNQEHISKRTVLDFLSGIISPISTLGIYCTNDVSELDNRINRKGRFKETITVGLVDDAGIRRWLKFKYDYDVPRDIVLKDMLCADIFDRMDTLDDPDAFVLENMKE